MRNISLLVGVFMLAAPAAEAAWTGGSMPAVPAVAPAADISASLSVPVIGPALDPDPSVESSVRHFYCVEYARLRSGLEIFGDAKFWWARARNLYARLSAPVNEAVMVFKNDRRIRRGHVAVVTAVISPREIRIDQANWQNHGEIEHDIPVRDVSAKNNWSQVRVWDIGSASFGRVYGVSGFIAKSLVRQAANN